METQKIVNLSTGSDNDNSRFSTKKWYIIDSESKGNYSTDEEITFLTISIESSLCNYSDAYILVTGNVTVNGGDNNIKVAFKNCVPFEKCRTEINETFVEVKLLMLIIFQIICHHLSINQVLLVIQKIME